MAAQKVQEKKIKDFVKDRYGQIAKKKASSCCCNGVSALKQAEAIGYSLEELKKVPDAAILGLGCGNPVALSSLKKGEVVLDLGSGGGIDVFLAANRVGPKGWVIGVDITPEMIRKSRLNAKKGGYQNVEFRLGEIEDLPVEENSVDVIISNCVINLAPDKGKAFAEAYRVIKPGGRMVISDIVTDRALPDDIRKSFPAWAECIGGALLRKDYLDKIKKAGFSPVKILDETIYLEEGMSEKIKGRIISIKLQATKARKPRPKLGDRF
jgi:arsenite methyltransferase